MARLIAIGDIHGQARKLALLLEQVHPTDRDQLVLLGDYIDRGPDSHGVIEQLLQLRADLPRTVFLRGNHELMLLNALVETSFHELMPSSGLESYSNLQLYLFNGGHATLASYEVQGLGELPEEHLAFIRQTRLYFRKDGFLFVHAGARNDMPLEQQDEYTLLWERHSAPGENEVHVVGHTPTADGLPLFEAGRYSLDTGAGFGGSLTACEVNTRQIWQI